MNSGFIQFKTRLQAETAKSRMNGKEYFGMPLRIDWGRSVMTAASWSRHSLQPQVERPMLAPMPPTGITLSGSSQLAVVPVCSQRAGEEAPSAGGRKSRWNIAKTMTVTVPEDKDLK